VPLPFQQQGSDGAVDSARHGDEDFFAIWQRCGILAVKTSLSF
jgi:hypothetical protein